MRMFGGSPVETISAPELQQRLEKGEHPQIVDVRDSWEYAEGHVPGAQLRPLGDIATWSRELQQSEEIILICRSGARSEKAYQFLRSQGFTNLKNVTGGIIGWRGAIER